jgi:hypothetical protein
MSTIESRFAAIERQLRFHQLVIAGLLVALVALVSYGATEGVPDEIRAKKFAVVNEEGREVVVIESWAHGGWIATFPAKGLYLPSFLLSHTDDGHGLLTVRNKDGKDIVYAGATESGSGALAVFNKDGKNIIYAGGAESGDGLLNVYNKDGGKGVRVQGTTPGGGGGSLLVSSKTGETVVQILADEYGMGSIGAFDRQGKGRTLTPR